MCVTRNIPLENIAAKNKCTKANEWSVICWIGERMQSVRVKCSCVSLTIRIWAHAICDSFYSRGLRDIKVSWGIYALTVGNKELTNAKLAWGNSVYQSFIFDHDIKRLLYHYILEANLSREKDREIQLLYCWWWDDTKTS